MSLREGEEGKEEGEEGKEEGGMRGKGGEKAPLECGHVGAAQGLRPTYTIVACGRRSGMVQKQRRS